MSSPEKLEPSDAVLLRYLLGALPVDEAEPIEEASVVDDDLAARLNAMERDLVDSYVRGELEGLSLTKFQTWYLSSPLRVQKVEAAREILRIADAVAVDVATSTTPEEAAPQIAKPAPVKSSAPTAHAAPSPSPVSSIAPTLSYGGASSARESSAWRFGKLSAWPTLGFAAAFSSSWPPWDFSRRKTNSFATRLPKRKSSLRLQPGSSMANTLRQPLQTTTKLGRKAPWRMVPRILRQ